MEYITYTLPNGIRCIHKQVRSSAVHCSLTIGTGSRDELPAEHGIAHLLEHCLFKGTARRKAYHINCRLENLGGELNAYTTKEDTVIHTSSLRGDFMKSAELVYDIVFNSTFPQKEIDKEKVIIVDEINSYKDSPAERIYDDFEDMVFAGSSLGHNILGSKNSVMKYTREDILKFVARTYNTDQMVFASIGNISEKRFRAVCDKYFAGVPSSPRTFERDANTPYVKFDKTVNRSLHQTHYIIGNRAYGMNDTDGRVALSLLTNILGGPSANSLLNVAIRERNGLSYNVESGYMAFTDTGISTIYFSTDRENLDQCIDLVNKELFKITHCHLSPRLLSIAKKQFIGQMTIAMESREGDMLGAARSCLIHNRIDSPEDIRKKIMAIKEEDIIRVANDIYGSNLSTLIYK